MRIVAPSPPLKTIKPPHITRKKANKFEAAAKSLDTKKGRASYVIKRGAAITAGLLAAGYAVKKNIGLIKKQRRDKN